MNYGISFPMLSVIPYSGWTAWTPVIPKLYWDVYSAEQRLKALCERLSKTEQYMDYVADTVNDYAENVGETVADELYKAHVELMNLREELIELILQVGEGSLDWNVQKGIYDSTVHAMRDMFNDVTVHALYIDELNALDMTVEELANSGLNVRGLAVMSRWLVNNDEPIYPPYMIAS